MVSLTQRAEEVAKEIMVICQLPTDDDPKNGFMSSLVAKSIAAALQRFAEAEVEAEIKERLGLLYESKLADARNVALEEAAKESEECPDENYGEDCHESISRRIRALKTGGSKE